MNIDVTGEPILRGLRAHFISPDYEWRSVRDCASCGTSEGIFDVAAVKSIKEVSLVTSVCRRCGYGFHSRRPQAQWYRDFYASQWDKAGRANEPDPKSLPPGTKILDICEPFLGPKGDVLEIGCGFGQSLLGFQRRGYGVYGVEAASHRSRFVRENWGIPCESTCVEEFLSRGADRKFDLVMSHHVLEHLEDPNTYVEALPRLLRPGGYAYLCVPDFGMVSIFRKGSTSFHMSRCSPCLPFTIC
jgi:SAM-dependent methyltransferase